MTFYLTAIFLFSKKFRQALAVCLGSLFYWNRNGWPTLQLRDDISLLDKISKYSSFYIFLFIFNKPLFLMQMQYRQTTIVPSACFTVGTKDASLQRSPDCWGLKIRRLEFCTSLFLPLMVVSTQVSVRGARCLALDSWPFNFFFNL